MTFILTCTNVDAQHISKLEEDTIVKYMGSRVSLHFESRGGEKHDFLVARLPARCPVSKKMSVPIILDDVKIFFCGHYISTTPQKKECAKSILLQHTIMKYNVLKVDKTYCRIYGETAVMENASEVVFLAREIHLEKIPAELAEYISAFAKNTAWY